MEIARITVSKVSLDIRQSCRVTTGMVGATVIFDGFSPEWEGLSKTVVFRTNGESRDVVNVQPGDLVVIPWEVLGTVGAELMVGVCGTDADGTLVIPTVWGDLGRIASGARPVGRPAEPPTPDWTQQIEGQVNRAIEAAQAAGPLVQQAADHAAAAAQSAEDANRFATDAYNSREEAQNANTQVQNARNWVDQQTLKVQGSASAAAESAQTASSEADRAKREADRAAQGGTGQGGTTDHNLLSNRDAENQHPMSAITGLSGALGEKMSTAEHERFYADLLSGKDVYY